MKSRIKKESATRLESVRRCGAVWTCQALILVGATLFVAPVAHAGSYTVRSCSDVDGAPLPAGDAAGGWIASGVGLSRDASNACESTNPQLLASIGGLYAVPVGQRVVWQFSPPFSTLISAYRVEYSGYARPFDNGQNRGVIGVVSSDAGLSRLEPGNGNVANTVVARDGLHDSWLQVAVSCDGPTGAADCAPGQLHASLALRRSAIALEDDAPPTSSAPSGSAVDLPTRTGTQLLAFRAADVGGGVYQAIVEVDGGVAQVSTLDAFGGRCVDAGGGARIFHVPQPCPLAVDSVLPIDANALPAGAHDITVRVTDAAGNPHTVFSARRTIVAPARTIGPSSDPAERGPANGENATDAARLTARWVGSRKATRTTAYGRRSVIRGRLTDTQKVGVRGARIELLAAVVGRAGTPLDKGGARTRGDGRFTIILPRNVSSRSLLLRYRSHLNDTVAVASAALRLRVRAGVRLHVSPQTARRGSPVRLSGGLAGRPVPRGGKVVELQARGPREQWITFQTVRTTRTGAFVARYRFRRPGPARFQMRVRVRATSDYPYATGRSRPVVVRVR